MTFFPTIAAGAPVDATLLQGMLQSPGWFALKANDTSRISTTTVASDPEITLTLAIGTWWIEMDLAWASDVAADFKCQWAVPSGTTGNRRVNGPGSTASDASADNMTSRWGIHGPTTPITYGARTSATQAQCQERALLVITTAGAVTLQWAQGVSTAVNTTVFAGSLMRAWRLA